MSEVNLQLVKELRDRTQLGLNACKDALVKCNGDVEAAIDFLKKAGELRAADRAGRIATEGKVVTIIYGNVAAIAEVNCQTDFVAKGESFTRFSKKVVSSLASLDNNDLESERKQLVARTGENIVIRRSDRLEAKNNKTLLMTYNHPGDRIAVILEVEAPDEHSYQLQIFADFVNDCAMQIAAMSPIAVSKESLSVEVSNKQKEIFLAQMMEDEKMKSKPQAALDKIVEGKLAKWYKDVTLLEQDSVISTDKKTVDQLRQELSKMLGGDVIVHQFIRFELGEGLEKKVENLAEEVAKLVNS